MSVEPLVRVESRSEGSGEQRPVGVRIGGERLEVRRVIHDAVEGSAVAGAPTHRRLLVELEDGAQLDLRRRLPDGPWRLLAQREA